MHWPRDPYISVLLPVYNGGAFLRSAVDSVLAQSLGDFECLIVDDGSTDGSAAVAAEYARRDARVRLLRMPGRRGLVEALNAALAAARAPLLARMDADDVALPGRFARQAAELEREPAFAFVGSRVAYQPDGPGTGGLRRYVEWQNSLLTPDDIRRDLFVESPVVHPTVLMRRRVVEAVGGYRDRGWPEDYDLWMRLLLDGGAAAKVPETLLVWRDHRGRLSRCGTAYSLPSFRRLKLHYLVRAWLRRGERVQVCGAGPTGRWWARELMRAGYAVSRIIEIDPRRVGRRYRGIPIVDGSGLRSGSERIVSAVASRAARESIRANLRAEGLVEIRDFVAVA
jgi:glycosyltransferase involved in cell wall biosynthesis